MNDFIEGSGIAVNMLLCDSAQVTGGKLFLLGGGLATIGPKPQPLALAFHISMPWDYADTVHRWRVDLLDEDGRPVTLQDKPLILNGTFRPQRNKNLRPGTPLGISMAINISPFPLEPSTAYAFALAINDKTEPHWRASFFVKP